ncbi:stage III sporulation protein AC [Clostridium sporogenes ATCC 15579]|nr:stage III sporulation protein AC [Clostridium sporogenes ATCC 15579]
MKIYRLKRGYNMLDIQLIFKIAGVSILVIILDKILKSSGKDDYAVVTNLAGIVVILMMVINLINKLFNAVKTMFQI